MSDVDLMPPDSCDVAIIGAGPSGLATATRLKKCGVDSVHMFEREDAAGGIPRHCGHPPFGMREFKWCLTGPAYARRLTNEAETAGVQIHLNTTVVQLHPEGNLTLSTSQGIRNVSCKRVVISTGVRETPRAPRFISGQRPLGILTTGALQSMVYLAHNKPFTNPVVIGTELVAFSALLTCHHGGIKPVAMIEEENRITARAFCRPLPTLMGVPLHLNTRLLEILGKDRVTGVRLVDNDGKEQTLNCDGVLFTGQFTPESSLLRQAHLAVDQATGGPVVDQYGRCSDPSYLATGNVLRPVETAGWCWREGTRTASNLVADLAGALPDRDRTIAIMPRGAAIRLVVPQVLSLPTSDQELQHLQLRFSQTTSGRLSLRQGAKTVWSRYLSVRPERRICAPLPYNLDPTGTDPLVVCFED